ncbi:hypothetical protein FUA23_00540 [Neolewinella aurantiaca]|uniref:Uncharacterized protein n=1 Tax=Neolewinella aurantiaca TaxID=2602767 RepID=A0A5C7FYM5_9BACT|nr:hypothetical protein [Neolewinella aurantiaca]TXF91706.1 hypothetical protein FUA23_00540 [Neolewinella aurantiaca]
MRFLTFFILAFLSSTVGAQIATPILLEAQQGKSLAWEGQLEIGAPLTSLNWAWSSQNACFVEPRVDHFSGNNVFYRTEIPKYSTMVIRLTPKDINTDLSLYAYSGGGGALPPELYSCVSCEADFRMTRNVLGRTRKSYVREVELRAVNRPYPVTIGVVGAQGLSSGDYILEISVVKNR